MRLYQSTEREFKHNGIGFLQPISCFVTEERNGEFELEMQYPIIGEHFNHIQNRQIILAKPNPTDDEQPFRIYKITKPMNGIVSIYARHISYDLSGITLSPFTAENAADAMSKIKTFSSTENPFTFWTDKSVTSKFIVDEPQSVRAIMGGKAGSLLDVYRGEYSYDKFTVRLYMNRGRDNGVIIRYGKNLTDLKQDENIEAVYTGVYPFWRKEDDYLELPEKTLNAEGLYNFTRIRPLDLSAEWEEKPTHEQLRNHARSYMEQNKIGIPSISIKVSFIPLEQTEEYKNLAIFERVNLCDTVTVQFEKLGINAKADCIKTIYNVLLKRYHSIELGEARTNITDTIASQGQEINKTDSKINMAVSDALNNMEQIIQQEIESATNWLTNGKGYMVQRRDGNGNTVDVLFMDTPNIETAINLLRIGQSGIGFSHNGINGPYTSAWTIDGHFNADFITGGTINAAQVELVNLNASNINAGTLMADLVRAGMLKSKDGLSSWNLDTGALNLFGTFKAQGTLGGVFSTKAELQGGGLSFTIDEKFAGGINISNLDGNGVGIHGDKEVSIGTWRDSFAYICGGESSRYMHKFSGDIAILRNSRLYFSDNIFVNAGYLGDSPAAYFNNSIYCEGSFSCGGTKYRAVKTDYGTIGMNSFETMGAHFADFGSATVDETKKCYVWLDPVFRQTIESEQKYQVFITPTNNKIFGNIEKHSDYFIVNGEDGLEFDWQIVCKQKGFSSDYGEQIDIQDNSPIEFDDSIFYDDTDKLAEEYLSNYEKEISDYD